MAMSVVQCVEAAISGMPVRAEPGIHGCSTVCPGFALPLPELRLSPGGGIEVCCPSGLVFGQVLR